MLTTEASESLRAASGTTSTQRGGVRRYEQQGTATGTAARTAAGTATGTATDTTAAARHSDRHSHRHSERHSHSSRHRRLSFREQSDIDAAGAK